MLNYNSKTLNTVVVCISLVICIILFIILDSCFLNIPNNKNNQNISVSFMNIQKNQAPNRKDLDSIDIQNVFLELMQVAVIYDDSNIRVEDVETGDEKNSENAEEDETIQEMKEEPNDNETSYLSQTYSNSEWRIEIPKLGLIAPIKTGTTQEVLATAVGHFEGSSKWNGRT